MIIIKKQVNQQIKKQASTDSSTIRISGYASVFSDEPDSQGDIIEKNAFKQNLEALKASLYPIPMLWNHKSESPIGKWIEYRIDAKGIWVMGHIYLDTEDAHFVAKGVKNTYISGLSLGFTIVNSKFVRNETTNKRSQVITKARIHEISVVVMPAGGIHTRIYNFETN